MQGNKNRKPKEIAVAGERNVISAQSGTKCAHDLPRQHCNLTNAFESNRRALAEQVIGAIEPIKLMHGVVKRTFTAVLSSGARCVCSETMERSTATSLPNKFEYTLPNVYGSTITVGRPTPCYLFTNEYNVTPNSANSDC